MRAHSLNIAHNLDLFKIAEKLKVLKCFLSIVTFAKWEKFEMSLWKYLRIPTKLTNCQKQYMNYCVVDR